MTYYNKYIIYKNKYLQLKGGIYPNPPSKNNRHNYQKQRANHPSPLFSLWDKQIDIFKEYFDEFRSLDELNVLEVGIGDARRSIPLSRMFNSYIGLEPSDTIGMAKYWCEKYKCEIDIVTAGINKNGTKCYN